MKAYYCEQRSATWFQLRCGRVTASEMANVMQFVSKGSKERGDKHTAEGAKRRAYKAQLLCERLTGQVDMEGYLSGYMQRGNDEECSSVTEYESQYGVTVDPIGFVVHETMDYLGCSPDGLIGKNGGFEIKNPASETHLAYLLAGVLPEEYEPQVMTSIDCCEREWWDFMSRDSRLPNPIRRFVVRVYRDEVKIAALRLGASLFNEQVNEMIDVLRKKYGEFTLPAQTVAKVKGDPALGEFGIIDDEIRAVDPSWQRASY